MIYTMTKAANGFDYKSPKWKALRKAALKQAKGRCVFCGAGGSYMYVDHKHSVRTRPDLAFDLSNLQVLCATHHNGLKAKIERRADVVPVGLDGYPQASAWSAMDAMTISSDSTKLGLNSPAY